MFTSHVSRFSRDFSGKVLKALSKKNVFIYGAQAIPDYAGDTCFQGVGYCLEYKGTSFIRTYRQIEAMAASSWNPEDGI